jgi:hypothetical protein
MAVSPFRFNATREDAARGTRTGLGSITSGAASGGAAYGAAALRPGSAGYMASSFGGPPRTDYVPPVLSPAPTVAPTPEPEPAPVAPAEQFAGMSGPNAGDGGEGGPDGVGGAMPGGQPGDLSDLMGGFEINGAGIGGTLGGALGGLAGPVGALAGYVGGRAIGGMFDGGGGGGGSTGASSEAASASGGSPDSQAAGYGGGYGGIDGFGGLAQGGWATPGQQRPQALADVQAGGYMGGYADGGSVDMARISRTRPETIMSQPSPGAQMQPDARINANNFYADSSARSGLPPWPGGYADQNYIAQLLQNRPDLVAALLQAQEYPAAEPPPANNPSTGMGYMGAYAGGGPVGMPDYAQGGTVDELAGPNPPGPDDGFAALDRGEFVVRADQAQREEYAPVLEEINQGTYQPAQAAGMTEGSMPVDGTTHGDPGALPPHLQQALASAAASDPMLQAALLALLGPDAAHSMIDSTANPAEMMAPPPSDRGPLAGPAPVPGDHAPPGVRPPNAPMPMMGGMPPPPPQRPGLAGVMA